MKEYRYCSVAHANCTAPAGYGIPNVGTEDGDRSCRKTCVVCGDPVCANCSRVIRLRRWPSDPPGKRRVCNNCLEDMGLGVAE